MTNRSTGRTCQRFGSTEKPILLYPVNAPTSVLVEFGDSQFAVNIRAGVTRIEELIRSELFQSDEVIRDAVPKSLATNGIRIRPLFTVLAAQFGPHPDMRQITVAGAAIELMHLATLCHGEVTDVSETGRAASSIRWNNNVAILAGDYRFAAVSRLGSWLGPRAFHVIAETFAELVTGQMREARGTADQTDLFDHYLRCVSEKTGSMVAAAGQLAAIFSGASDEETVRMSRLGRLVGIAFQISYDMLAGAGNAEFVHKSLPSPKHNTVDVFTMLRSAAGLADAREAVDAYLAQAHEEIARLPECAARQALIALVDSAALGISPAGSRAPEPVT